MEMGYEIQESMSYIWELSHHGYSMFIDYKYAEDYVNDIELMDMHMDSI